MRLVSSANTDDRAAMLLGVANCDLMTHQYTAALNSYSEASLLARRTDTKVRVATGRASVYRRMNNYAAALEVMRQLGPLRRGEVPPVILLQAANVWRDFDMNRSAELYNDAIEGTVSQRDRPAEALARNQLGYALLLYGRLSDAEQALKEALNIRSALGDKQVQTTYYYLALLKRKQGDLAAASAFLESAEQQASRQIPAQLFHYERATLARLAGRKREALDAFREAINSAREWRQQFLAAQEFRISAEVPLQLIYSNYIECAMEVYEESGEQELMKTALLLSGESVALMFRESLAAQKGYPPEYWQVLAKFRRALSDTVNSTRPEQRNRLEAYRLELSDIESRAGGTIPSENSHQIFERTPPRFPLSGLQRKLSAGEARITFYTGETASFRWALSGDRLEARRLPSRSELAAMVRSFRSALESRSGEAIRAGAVLYQTLLGGLSRSVVNSQRWVLSLDGPLFELPFAALVVQQAPSTRYLVEDHSLRVIPSVSSEFTGEKSDTSNRFAGVGDPIYNAADPRWRRAGGSSTPTPQLLARLPGSAREIRQAAKSWKVDPEPALLTGSQVSGRAIRSLLELRPAVLHIATHVVRHPSSPSEVLIALGLQDDGEAEYLGPAEIVSRRCKVGLVTLSGCGSGQGAALPGLGLFGLTRSWLIAGARTVAATYWPILDDDGTMVGAFYEKLHNARRSMAAPEVAESLRQAQLEMLASKTDRAHPSYWAAFFVLGKE